MANKGGNPQNLKPVSSVNEARKKGKNGGKKSAEIRKERKKLKEELLTILETVDPKKGKSVNELISLSLVRQALRGNTKAFEIIRDTIGEKPIDTLNLGAAEKVSGIEISFVNKSKPSAAKEKDPKIVGEYTPPIDIKEG